MSATPPTENKTSNQKINNSRYVSLRIKLLVIFTIVFSVLFAGTYYWFYQYSTNAAMNRIGEDLKFTLQGAVAGIDGDEFLAMVNDAGYQEMADTPFEERKAGLALPTDDARFTTHEKWIKTIHDIEPRAFPYTYVKGYEPGDEADRFEVLFVGDILRITQPENATLFLESYPNVKEMLKGFDGILINTYTYTDDWGRWMSGYAPITNTNGEVVGGMGIDFKADYVDEVQETIKSKMFLAALLTYGLLFIVVFAISSILTKPIINLTEAAERIGEGDYEQDWSKLKNDKLPDEIDKLADVFSIMVGKVYKREQTLRKQVESLTIQVDTIKRQQQVSDIVETDFFKDLQEKANEIRTRRNKQSGEKDNSD